MIRYKAAEYRDKWRQNDTKAMLNYAILGVIMVFIGVFTVFAAANTYEVITMRNLPNVNVVETIAITPNNETNNRLVASLNQSYNNGSFGIPKKIKMPESSKHLDIHQANYDGGWLSRKGVGSTFIADNARQKVFGKAVIYFRINTTTTKDLGHIYTGDVVNVVTTEGWQLGYKVMSVSPDSSALLNAPALNDSEIVIITVDAATNEMSSYRAVLAKVGERV